MSSRPLFPIALAAALVGLFGTPSLSAGQEGCVFGDQAESLVRRTLVGGGSLFYLGEPHFICDDGVVEIRADSAVVYSAQNMTHLIGHVRYFDQTRQLTADVARYFTRQGRLQAQGSVVVRDTVQGSVIENGDLVYLRQTEYREQEQMTFRTWTDGVRPTALLFMQPSEPDSAEEAGSPEEGSTGEAGAPTEDPDAVPALQDASSISFARPATPALRDSASISLVLTDTTAAPVPEAAEIAIEATPAEPDTVPYRVTGDQIFLQGDSYFRATGNVVIERDRINAYGQVAEYDQVAGRILLEQQARVETSTYDLKGRVINIGMVNGAMRNIRAIRDGILTGDDLVLTAPLIHLFLDDGAMERLVAMPMEPDPDSVAAGVPVDSTMLEKPVAVAEEFSLIADSLDVRSPGEVLERIIAVGNARGESRARDSLNVEVLPEVARSDWLEGDTVIATFGEVLVVDTTTVSGTRTDYRLEQLEAKSDARSLYRLQPSDSTREAGVDPPAIHYVVGQEILIVLDDGEVDHMDVQGQTRGFHLEPLAPAVADSLAADSLATDSLATGDTIPADTIRPDTTEVKNVSTPDSSTVTRTGQAAARASRRPDPFNRSRRPW